ncbi:EVE domain-containing protein [bacterium]|nr:EVE domain-containing protein [bacterium]
MNFYIVKTEAKSYSIDDLERDKTTKWDGVHSYQAINNIKQWSIGDLVLIYHSTGESQIVGLGEVISIPEKDMDDPRGISYYSYIKFIRKFNEDNRITLKQIKETNLFNDFTLVRQSRLSVILCSELFINWLISKGVNLDK